MPIIIIIIIIISGGVKVSGGLYVGHDLREGGVQWWASQERWEFP